MLPALLQSALRRELQQAAGAAAATAAAAAAAATQQQGHVPAPRALIRLLLAPQRRCYAAVPSQPLCQAAAAATPAATPAAAEASAAASWPPPPPEPWRPPEPDHLASRRRGFTPPTGPDLGRRTKHACVVRYPFSISYYSPKPVFLYSLDGRVLARRELPGDVFNVPVRTDILHRVVRWQRAKAQQGTHKVKDRSEVSGGGRKPWQQKGSGRARQGSIRAPQWRGGGVAHGPKPRSHAHRLPKKVRRMGLKCALSAKAHEGRLLLLDSLQPDEPKTRALAAALRTLLAGRPRRSALLIDSAKDAADGGAALRLAGRNLQGIDIVPADGANVYGILRRDVLVMTAAAADALVERLRAPINRMGAAGRAYQERMQAIAAAQQAAAGGAAEQRQQQ